MNLIQHIYNSQASSVSLYARQAAENICKQLLGKDATSVLDENIKKISATKSFPPAFVYALHTLRKKGNENIHFNAHVEFATKSQIADAMLYSAITIGIHNANEESFFGGKKLDSSKFNSIFESTITLHPHLVSCSSRLGRRARRSTLLQRLGLMS